MLASNSTGSVTSANTVDAANKPMPMYTSGCHAKIKPRMNIGVESDEQMFTAGTMAERRFSGA